MSPASFHSVVLRGVGFGLLACLCGCVQPPLGYSAIVGDDAGTDHDAGTDRDAGAAPDATASPTCQAVADGTPCGSLRHCIDERCLHNRCGDGIAADAEQCDDGNQRDDDACLPSCVLPSVRCGDGITAGVEQCDDGNTIDDDACTSRCTLPAPPDAGPAVGPTGCASLASFEVTPYAGEDERLEGNYFYVTARFSVEPVYATWAATGGQVFAREASRYAVGYFCEMQGMQTIALLTASPYCTAASHVATVLCRGQ